MPPPARAASPWTCCVAGDVPARILSTRIRPRPASTPSPPHRAPIPHAPLPPTHNRYPPTPLRIPHRITHSQVGKHPIQLYSLGTPNGVKVTILLEELVESDPTFDYDAWLVRIDGQQVHGRWGALKV